LGVILACAEDLLRVNEMKRSQMLGRGPSMTKSVGANADPKEAAFAL
jgi:hypothetical protein